MKTALLNLRKNTEVFGVAPLPAEQRFLQAYHEHSDAIFRYCYWRMFDRDKAKDCVQEAFCRTWKYIGSGKDVENIRAFLYKTANNIIIDGYRKKKNVSLDYIMEKGFAPKIDYRQQTQEYFMNQDALNVIKSLDEKYRDVILMKYVEDLSTKEIALALRETENNVYVRLSRGLEKVRDIIKEGEAKVMARA